jgi:hypothetical protein
MLFLFSIPHFFKKKNKYFFVKENVSFVGFPAVFFRIKEENKKTPLRRSQGKTVLLL